MYTLRVHPEIQELQVKLKEILYDCMAGVKSTKAALFLFDQPSNRFELVTEYGFRGAIRLSAERNDPIVDRCGRARTPFYVNGLAAEPRFSEILFEGQSDRMLIAPVYLRGQLVGFIDMRDKAGKLPFENGDLPNAQLVADRVSELFTTRNVFGQRFITLSGNEPMQSVLTGIYSPAAQPSRTTAADAVSARPATAEMPAVKVPPPPPAAASYVPRIASVVLEARTAAERLRLGPSAESLTESEMGIVRDILRSVLLIPGAVVAAFSAFGQLGGVQEIAARAPMTDEALALLQSKLNAWLAKRGEGGGTLRNRVQLPFGSGGAAMGAADISKVFTAPIVAASIRGLFLSAGFSAVPDRGTHELLAAFHQQLQLAIEQSIGRRQAATDRARIAEKIVEPDFSRFPELRNHSSRVAAATEAFARALGLGPADVETARIAALVHDTGMRLLEYERLYRKRDISPDDLQILKEHANVGAAIIEPLLGPEIAFAVLCHHERFDGRGYPGQLAGDQIPLLSRLIQICDVYEAMTSTDNYQAPQTHEAAMATIAHGAGSQFDPELARRFGEMMRAAPR